MNIYLINIALIFILGIIFLDVLRGRIYKRIYFGIVATQIAIITGLRGYSIGSDTTGYAWHFKQTANMSLDKVLYGEVDMERAYVLLEYGVSRISENPTLLFFIIAIFFSISVSKLIYRNSTEPCLSFILFSTLGFLTFSMTGMRQTIALAILMYSFQYAKKRKLFKFLITVFFASLFHLSALIFLLAYFLAYRKLTRGYVLAVFLTIPMSYIFRGTMFSLLSQISGYGYEPYPNQGAYVLIGLMIMILIAAFVQRESLLRRDKRNLVYFNMLIASIVVGMITFINPSALRAAYYYYIYLILFVPEIINSIKDDKLRRIFYVIAIILLMLLYMRTLVGDTVFSPYEFYFQ